MIPFGDEPEEQRKVYTGPKRAPSVSSQAVLFGDEPEEQRSVHHQSRGAASSSSFLFGPEPEESSAARSRIENASSAFLFGPEPEESSGARSGIIDNDPSDDEGLVLGPKTLAVDTCHCLVFLIFVHGPSKLSFLEL